MIILWIFLFLTLIIMSFMGGGFVIASLFAIPFWKGFIIYFVGYMLLSSLCMIIEIQKGIEIE